MQLIEYRKENLLAGRSRAIVIFFVLGVLCFFSSRVNAEVLGSVITYQDSITYDEEEGKLFFPSFVYAEPSREEIYIIDGKGRIIIYTADFFPIHTLGKKNGIQAPQGMTVDIEGNLYVAQSATESNPRHRISVFSPCLEWERDIYFTGFEGADLFAPHRLAVDKKGNIYVAANYFPGVLILDAKGRFLDIMSADEGGKKAGLTNVTIDNSGRIYLLSEEEGRIYVYDENNKFIFKFGEKGGSTGKLSRPKAVGIDNKSGRIYTVDYMRHAVSVYDREGVYLFEFGGLGWGEGWFQYPTDIAVDNSGRIFVADLFNNRVQIFNSW
ncbi:MAG: NHL repeat-containing protein [Nitrospirota bacterium]|nr:NHL repeat-containing protein [Nitrospirota bacterium]